MRMIKEDQRHPPQGVLFEDNTTTLLARNSRGNNRVAVDGRKGKIYDQVSNTKDSRGKGGEKINSFNFYSKENLSPQKYADGIKTGIKNPRFYHSTRHNGRVVRRVEDFGGSAGGTEKRTQPPPVASGGKAGGGGGGASLLVSPVLREAEGLYTCLASNTEGDGHSNAIMLRVRRGWGGGVV